MDFELASTGYCVTLPDWPGRNGEPAVLEPGNLGNCLQHRNLGWRLARSRHANRAARTPTGGHGLTRARLTAEEESPVGAKGLRLPA